MKVLSVAGIVLIVVAGIMLIIVLLVVVSYSGVSCSGSIS